MDSSLCPRRRCAAFSLHAAGDVGGLARDARRGAGGFGALYPPADRAGIRPFEALGVAIAIGLHYGLPVIRRWSRRRLIRAGGGADKGENRERAGEARTRWSAEHGDQHNWLRWDCKPPQVVGRFEMPRAREVRFWTALRHLRT